MHHRRSDKRDVAFTGPGKPDGLCHPVFLKLTRIEKMSVWGKLGMHVCICVFCDGSASLRGGFFAFGVWWNSSFSFLFSLNPSILHPSSSQSQRHIPFVFTAESLFLNWTDRRNWLGSIVEILEGGKANSCCNKRPLFSPTFSPPTFFSHVTCI